MIIQIRAAFVLKIGAIMGALALLSQSAIASSSSRAIVCHKAVWFKTSRSAPPLNDLTFECWVMPKEMGHASALLYFGDPASGGFGLTTETNSELPGFATINIAQRFEPATGN